MWQQNRSGFRGLVRTLPAVLLLAAGSAFCSAQELEIAISPSPVGSGARAAGMADAFVAIADDATAASWNPAGLVQLERPELSIVGAYNGLVEDFRADWHDEVDSRHSDDNLDLNFLSFTYPFPALILGRNSSVGLYYQHKYDLSRKFKLDFNQSTVGSDGIVFNNFSELDFKQDGALSAITPAFAFEVTHRLALGVAVNLWRSSIFSENGWTRDQRDQTFSHSANGGGLAITSLHEKYEDVEGENLTVGLLWNVTDKWSIGVRYDSAFTADSDYTRHGSTLQINLPQNSRAMSYFPKNRKSNREIRLPSTVAVGAAYRANDRLTLSCDVTTTDWNDFWFKDESGNRKSLVNARNLDQVWFAPHFEPTYTVRLGGEYVFIPKQPDEVLGRIWTLRGGLFYDQEPASGGPDNFWGGAVGVGLLAKERVNVDLAYQVRYGHEVNHDFVRGVPGFDEDVIQSRFLISTVIYF